ncbi:ABC transporter permease [Atopomonas sediminilitoris]|uniref:ABC transporter permease n=1 Tax=Atopomonas sediminilitoris TaxID=2919919 RepID=UPI001F4E12DC|nr:ABC transporter permease subunit [Atopomonas sediminilitoris]MCJ8169867.1 ABC transporter permease subunit [Atopomonas sediminilitoris]
MRQTNQRRHHSHQPSPQHRHYTLIVWALVGLLALPLLATLLYSLASRWGATMLPDGLTLRWYLELWGEPRFLAAFARSLLLCFAALALSLALILPLALVAHTRWPWLDKLMKLLMLLPFAVPPVVGSVGLLQLYAGGPLPLVGTPWILIACFFTLTVPFMYQAMATSLKAIPLRDLLDAAHLLGASTPQAFIQVILPNLRNGVLVALFLSFSFLFGEFVFANLLVGTRYETLQVYLNNMRNHSGHFTSALVISYFFAILLLTWMANRFSRSA